MDIKLLGIKSNYIYFRPVWIANIVSWVSINVRDSKYLHLNMQDNECRKVKYLSALPIY